MLDTGGIEMSRAGQAYLRVYTPPKLKPATRPLHDPESARRSAPSRPHPARGSLAASPITFFGGYFLNVPRCARIPSWNVSMYASLRVM